jgi:hypothetical protein
MTSSPYPARVAPRCSTSTISWPMSQYACTMAVFTERVTRPRMPSTMPTTRAKSASSFALELAAPRGFTFIAERLAAIGDVYATRVAYTS